MNTKFIRSESNQHFLAKTLLKEWLDQMHDIHDETIIVGVDDQGTEYSFYCRSNRSYNCLLEYPFLPEHLAKAKRSYPFYTYDDGGTDLDEIYETVPTFEDLKQIGKHPLYIVDAVTTHKGMVHVCFEIVHTNPVPDDKLELMQQMGLPVFEIQAKDIMAVQHGTVPKRLKVKRLV